MGADQGCAVRSSRYTTVESADSPRAATANAPGQTIGEDHDGDGVDNGVEYFMGHSGSAFTANPAPAGGVVTWLMSSQYTGTYGTDGDRR